MIADFMVNVALPITLFCIMLSMGTRLSLDSFKLIVQAPISVVIGLLSQMVLFPVLAYSLLSLFKLPMEIFIGFMILALSPGGTTSNMFSYLARGNLALSISLTAIVSLISPLSIPLILSWLLPSQLEQTHIKLPFLPTLLQLILITLLPVGLGMMLRHINVVHCVRYELWLTRTPLIMMMLVIVGIFVQNSATMVEFFALAGLPALLLCSVALLCGYLFARSMKLNKADSRTIAIETAIQNGGTAILIAGTLLNKPTMTIAPFIYGIVMLLPVCLYLLSLRGRQLIFHFNKVN